MKVLQSAARNSERRIVFGANHFRGEDHGNNNTGLKELMARQYVCSFLYLARLPYSKNIWSRMYYFVLETLPPALPGATPYT